MNFLPFELNSPFEFQYWSIAPMEHLLARLELDDAPVCKRIVELTFNSYIPTDKPPEVCYCLTVGYILMLLSLP